MSQTDPSQTATSTLLRDATLEIRELRRRLASRQDSPEPLAIVSSACRLPGGIDTPDAYWEALIAGQDLVTEIPAGRWNADKYFDRNSSKPGKMDTKWGGFVDGIELFDPTFFGLSPREAASMDPQQRLLLEVAWEALENGGFPITEVSGSPTGVFVSAMHRDFALMQMETEEGIDGLTGPNIALSTLPNRLSYAFDLRGPSIAVESACSSALVSLHLAAQSLRRRDCDLALVAGVNVILSPRTTLAEAKVLEMAGDGRCKPFDESADGLVRSEGCIVVAVRRLADAVADGDPILALLRGTAVNQDGRTAGFGAPSARAQEAVIRRALDDAEVDPEAVTFIEAHGTGTRVGDPIEMDGLLSVYGKSGAGKRTCAVGSAKSNLGHLEAASGLAGLLKCILSMRNERIPPTLHLKSINPEIDLRQTRIEIPRTAIPWSPSDGPQIGAVSAFGAYGTNAHVILERPPVDCEPQEAESIGPWLVPLSGRTEDALEQSAGGLLDWLTSRSPEEDTDVIASLAHTSGARRSHFERRAAVVVNSSLELGERLEQIQKGARGTRIHRTPADRVDGNVFVFSGQGSQRAQMGMELFHREPAFREMLEICDELIRHEAGWSLIRHLAAGTATSSLHETDVAQPCIFAIQVSLARLWRDWGVYPEAVLGHSVGEIAAAHVAGILSLEDAAKLAVLRGQLMEPTSGVGGMLSVRHDAQGVAEAIEQTDTTLSIAALNGPRSTVVSGDAMDLESLASHFEKLGIKTKKLEVDYPFHSPVMQNAAQSLEKGAAFLRPQEAEVPFFSTTTGRIEQGDQLDSGYWAKNIWSPVHFHRAVDSALENGFGRFIELGGQPVLCGAIDEIAGESPSAAIAIPTKHTSLGEVESAREAAARAYVSGCSLRWREVNGSTASILPLPNYPWQKRRCWKAPGGSSSQHPSHFGTGLSTVRWTSPAMEAEVFECRLSPESPPFLQDHRVEDVVVVPAVVFLDMALSAGESKLAVEELEVEVPCVLTAEDTTVLQLVLQPTAEGVRTFEVFGRSETDPEWTRHARGRLGSTAEAEPPLDVSVRSFTETSPLSIDQFYKNFESLGLVYGPRFQGVHQLWRRGAEVVGELRLPEEAAEGFLGEGIHPVLLDSGMQLMAAALPTGNGSAPDSLYLPISIGSFRLDGDPSEILWGRVVVHGTEAEVAASLRVEVEWLAKGGRVVATMKDLRVRRTSVEALRKIALGNVRPATYELEWVNAEVDTSAAEDVGLDTKRYVLLSANDSLARDVAAPIRAFGAQCEVLSIPAEERSREEIGAAFSALPEFEGEDVVLCLWPLEDSTSEGQEMDLGRAGYGAVLALMQAASSLDGGSRELRVVTRGATSAHRDSIQVSSAGVLGLCRTAAVEQPEVFSGLLDLPVQSTEADARAVLRFLADDFGESELAVVDDGFKAPRLSELQDSNLERTQFRADATYLVTGGLGGVGLELSKWLVMNGARNLLLVGRSSPNAQARQQLEELERFGARVGFASVDVSSQEQVRRLVAEELPKWAPLCSVFHAAGSVRDAAIGAQTIPEHFEPVFDAKARGAWNLHQCLEAGELDHFVLFGSAAGLLGSAGQANYAAANAFLASLAELRRSEGKAALCVDWGAWQGAGMAADLEASETGKRLEGQGIVPFSADVALGRLGELIHSERPGHVMFAGLHWPRFLQKRRRQTSVLRQLHQKHAPVSDRKTGEKGILQRSIKEAQPGDRNRVLVEALRKTISEILQFTPQDTPDWGHGLFELGMDSLTVLELRNELEWSLDKSVSPTLALDFPTIEAIARHLLSETLELREEGTEGAEQELDEMLSALENAQAELTPEPSGRKLQ